MNKEWHDKTPYWLVSVYLSQIIYADLWFGENCDWGSSKWNDCSYKPLLASTVRHQFDDKANWNDQCWEKLQRAVMPFLLLAIVMIQMLLMMVHPCVQWQRTKKHQDCRMSVAKPHRDWKDAICTPQGDKALANRLHSKQIVGPRLVICSFI